MSKFTTRCRRAGVITTFLLGFMSASVRADIVSQELFKSTTLVTSSNINATEFNLNVPGTLVIELKDLGWPALLGTLSFSLLDDTAHRLQTFTALGAASNSWTFNVTAPGTFYGAIYAKPEASALAGMYYAKVSYQTVSAVPSAVPLPAAAWFLISGLAGLIAVKPKQKLSQI